MFLPLTAKFIITIDQWQLKMDQFNCKLDFYKDLLKIKYLKIEEGYISSFSKRQNKSVVKCFSLEVLELPVIVQLAYSVTGPWW